MHEATCWELVIHSSDLDNNNTDYYQANFRGSNYTIASIFCRSQSRSRVAGSFYIIAINSHIHKRANQVPQIATRMDDGCG